MRPEDQIPTGGEGSLSVEVVGLSLYTHHGVTEAEREIGQRLLFDLSFGLDHCDAVVTDRVEDTVDYAEVCDVVAMAASERSHKTLERLCESVAERLLERFPTASTVSIRAAKPEPPIGLPVSEVAVELIKVRPSDEDDEEAEV